MAKLTGTSRPDSRQSAEPAGRVTRARSATPQASVDVATTTSNAPSRARGPAQRQRQTELQPVREDDVEPEMSERSEAASSQSADDNLELTSRASVHSGFSGTTAKTAFSQEELEDLDGESMLDALPELASSAQKLIEFLLPDDRQQQPIVRKEIRTPGSSHNKRFNVRMPVFDAHRVHFGSTEYLQPTIVLRALLGVTRVEDVPQGSWRPDAMLYLINIAQMLRSIFVTVYDVSQIDIDANNAMENLDAYFPIAVAGPKFDESAFHLHLNLLTQLCIIRLGSSRAEPDYDPQSIIHDTFYDPGHPDESHFRHMDSLHVSSSTRQTQRDCIREIEEVVDIFTTAIEANPGSPFAAISQLREHFPWTVFIDRVTDYAEARIHELDEQIAAVNGGMPQILKGLGDEVQRHVRMREAEAKRQSLSRSGGTLQRTPLSGMQSLKAREKRLAQSTAPVAATTVASDAPAPAATDPGDHHWIAPLDDDDDQYPPQAQTGDVPRIDVRSPSVNEQPRAQPESELALPPTARASLADLSGFQRQQIQNAAKARGRFVDRQQGAQRVSWDDDVPSPQPIPDRSQHSPAAGLSGSRSQPSPRSSAKRTIDETDEPEDFDPTQDDGFQIGVGDMAAADARRRAAPQQNARPPRVSFATGTSGGSGNTASGSSALSRGAPASSIFPPTFPEERQNPGSSIPAPLAPLDPDDDAELPESQRYKRVKVVARINTVASMPPRPTQQRTKWSVDEEEALINLIQAHGPQWSRLKKHDEAEGENARLDRRSAEDMRFKARNMKVDYLTSGYALPANFDQVALDRKAMEKLAKHGIEYIQQPIRATAG